MDKRKINLEKVIENLGENIFPNIEYFMNGVNVHSDGNVDGSNDGLYQGLIHGEGLEELGIDKNVLNHEKPILDLCKIILEKNGTLFFKLGLFYSENYSEIEIDGEWFELDESLEKLYGMGGYGIIVTKNDWDYGYYESIMSHCFMPPEEKHYYLSEDKDDKIVMKMIKNLDEMDIYD